MAAFDITESNASFAALIDRAEHGEEVILARAGRPVAKIVPISKADSTQSETLRPFGQNFLGIDKIPDDFDDPLPEEYQRAFGMID